MGQLQGKESSLGLDKNPTPQGQEAYPVPTMICLKNSDCQISRTFNVVLFPLEKIHTKMNTLCFSQNVVENAVFKFCKNENNLLKFAKFLRGFFTPFFLCHSRFLSKIKHNMAHEQHKPLRMDICLAAGEPHGGGPTVADAGTTTERRGREGTGGALTLCGFRRIRIQWV